MWHPLCEVYSPDAEEKTNQRKSNELRDIRFKALYNGKECLVKTQKPKRKGCKGWYKENGYILRHVIGHPYANKRGYIAEHRLAMEEHIGRFLYKNEVVHHIDGNRGNNDINNLRLSINNAEHIKRYHKPSRNNNGQFVCTSPIFKKIKFRLWDKDRKVNLIYDLNKLITTTFRRSKFEFRGMFTGLKDKNGVEIYEGDIVSDGKNKYVVAFYMGAWRLERNVDGDTWWKSLYRYATSCEIIGDIYRNKELLEGK